MRSDLIRLLIYLESRLSDDSAAVRRRLGSHATACLAWRALIPFLLSSPSGPIAHRRTRAFPHDKLRGSVLRETFVMGQLCLRYNRVLFLGIHWRLLREIGWGRTKSSRFSELGAWARCIVRAIRG
jgi:hypothetical protein